MKPKRISKNRANNPVARAIAKQKLKEAMLDMRIHLLMMDDGADCEKEILTINESIHVVAYCYEAMGKVDSVEFRMLRSAIKILIECSSKGFIWDTGWAITIDNAIKIASEKWSKIPSEVFNDALLKLDEIKQRIAQEFS